jgi:hypothetical protein
MLHDPAYTYDSRLPMPYNSKPKLWPETYNRMPVTVHAA